MGGQSKQEQNDRIQTRTPPPSSNKTRTAWRSNWPNAAAPLNALFPPKAPSDTAPLVLAARSRAAWKSRKLLFRSIVATLTAFILELNPTTIVALGQASFFGVIMSVMLPPMFPLQLFLFLMIAVIGGMCFGWAWGVAAMRAALTARNQVLLASQVQRASASAAGAVNPSVQYRISIFRGEFLDWRSTAVFAAFFLVGCFALGLLRAKKPQLAIAAIFASIVLDVLCSYGPLFPVANYTLATIFLVPSGCYIAIGLACTILIFPESLNASTVAGLVDKVLLPVYQRNQLHSELLGTRPPSPSKTNEDDNSEWAAFSQKLDANQEKIASGLEGLLGTTPMLELEVSRGRLSAKDLRGIIDRLRETAQKSIGLGAMYRTFERQRSRRTAWDASRETAGVDGRPQQPRYAPHRMQRMSRKLEEMEATHQHALEHILPLLERASEPLRDAIDEALLGSMEYLLRTNDARWGRSSSAAETEQLYHSQHDKVLKLRTELEAFNATRRKEVLSPFKDFFDDHGHIKVAKEEQLRFSPASLLVVLSATDNLILFAEGILDLTKSINELENHRRITRLWWPTGLRKIGNLLKGGKRSASGFGDGDDPDQITLVGDEDAEENDGESASHDDALRKEQDDDNIDRLFPARRSDARDPDARPPKNRRQAFGVKIARFGRWLHEPDTIFAFKYAVGSVLLWIPQIVPNSAYFTYNERGLWALIMLQTGMATFAGDQLLQTVQKLSGTLAGLVWGMLIWYIGNGSGDGNYYGMGAAFVVFMTPALAVRLFSPPAVSQIGILFGVTTTLIVGYSWQDTHLPTLSNPGVGVSVAWRRALLVIIGITAALIVMVIPKPQSTRQLVRRTHATCIDEIGRLYSAIVSGWILEETESPHCRKNLKEEGKEIDSDRFGSDKHERAEQASVHLSSPFSLAVQKAARGRMLALWTKLNGTRARIIQSTYEPSSRGDWPREEYTRLLDTQLQLAQALAQLGSSLTRLGPRWRRILVRRTAFLNPNLISDVSSTFFLLSMALRDAHPLPEATPGPLVDRLLYHDRHLRGFTESDSTSNSTSRNTSPMTTDPKSNKLNGRTDDTDPEDDDYNPHHHHHPQVDGAKMGDFALTWSTLEDVHFARYASAVLALSNILSSLDEAESIVKGLVGTVKLPGYRQHLMHQASWSGPARAGQVDGDDHV